MREKIEASISNIRRQAQKVEVLLSDLQKRLAQVDRESAKASLQEFKNVGLSEIQRIKSRLQNQVMDLSVELSKTTEKIKSGGLRVRASVEKAIKQVKGQLKSVTETERKKRSGRRRRPG